MPISLAKKKAAPEPSSSGGGGGEGTSGAPLGLLAAFLAAGAFVARMYVPQHGLLAFQVLGGLAGLFGAFGTLAAFKGLRTGPRGSAALGLLLSLGALGAVAYGFTRPASVPAPEPPSTDRPGEVVPASTSIDTNAPVSTNAVAATDRTAEETNAAPPEILVRPIRVERLLPVTKRATLMRARTGKLPQPEPKPAPKPEVKAAKVAVNPATPEPPTEPAKQASKPEPFPELAALAPVVDVPPPPGVKHPGPRQAKTFREATLLTFEEINAAARSFEAVNKLDIAQLLDVTEMSNDQVIASRYRQVSLWLQRQAEFKSTIEQADAVYENRLCHANTPKDRKANTLAKFRETRERLYTSTITQTTAARRIVTAVADVLKVLGDNFGAWEFDPETKKILFEDPDVAAKYRVAVGKVKQASARAPGS